SESGGATHCAAIGHVCALPPRAGKGSVGSGYHANLELCQRTTGNLGTMTASTTPGKFAVVGNPIAHSRSPAIHALFAQQTGIDLVYTTLLAPLDNFKGTIEHFFAQGGQGLNITV